MILLTAFKGKHNSSCQLIKDLDCAKLFLTNSFAGLKKDIETYNCELYSAVVMFGLDAKLKDRIRIDTRAQAEFGIKDTILDVSKMSDLFDICGVPHDISRHPTNYLCNYAYYLMLTKMCGRTVFIHIPPEKYAADEFKCKLVSAVIKLMVSNCPSPI